MGKYVFPSALLACFIIFVFVPKNQVSFPEHLKRKSRPLQSAHVCMAHAFQLCHWTAMCFQAKHLAVQVSPQRGLPACLHASHYQRTDEHKREAFYSITKMYTFPLCKRWREQVIYKLSHYWQRRLAASSPCSGKNQPTLYAAGR